MAGTQAFCPRGTTIGYASVGAPTAFTPLEEVTKLGLPGPTWGTDDATNMDSVGSYREFINTLKDGGDLSGEANAIPGAPGQAGLYALAESGVTVNWKVTFPGGRGDVSFAGFVMKGSSMDLTPDKKATMAFTVKITGPIVTDFGS